MDMEQLQHKLEKIFLRKIYVGFRDNDITVDEARRSAQKLLDFEPFSSLDEAKNKLAEFVEAFPRFIEMLSYVDSYAEELRLQKVVDKMQKLIKNESIDEALKVAQSDE